MSGAGKDRWRWNNELDMGVCSQCSNGTVGIGGWEICERITGLKSIELAHHIQSILGTCQVATTEAPKDKTPYMKEMYLGSRPIEIGDPVWLYLENRGITPHSYSALRYHPALRHPDGGEHPAMLAMMGKDPVTGKYSGIHRTYLAMDGCKAKVDLGRVRLAYGTMGVVELGQPMEWQILGIAEGIETAMAANQLFGIPVWAALNAGMLEQFNPPVGTTHVTIFGDNDSNKHFTGQKAAYLLANRLARDFEVRVEIPDKGGTDWNDYLMQS
jgi:putative DNA primase/helicase